MATKRKNKKHHGRKTGHRRGRRVSGFGGGIPMQHLLAFGAGAVASKGLNGVTKNIQFVQDKPIVRPLVKLGIGYGLSQWNGAGDFVQNMGAGFIGEGALDLLAVAAPNVFQNLAGEPAVSGPGGMKLIDLDNMPVSGYEDIDVNVAGYDDDLEVL